MFYVEGIQYSVCTLGRRIAGRVTDVLRQKERRQHVSKEIKQKVIISELDLKVWLFFSMPVFESRGLGPSSGQAGPFSIYCLEAREGEGVEITSFSGGTKGDQSLPSEKVDVVSL